MSDHSLTILPAEPIVRGDRNGSLLATWLASCVCGWRAAQAYARFDRAKRAYYRHLHPRLEARA